MPNARATGRRPQAREVETRTDGPVEGTLASIAYRHLQDEPRFEWIREFDVDPQRQRDHVSNDEISPMARILLDQDVISHEAEADDRLPDLSTCRPRMLSRRWCCASKTRSRPKSSFGALLTHESFDFVRSLDRNVRDELRDTGVRPR